MSTLGVARFERAEAAQVAAISRGALDRPLHHEGELLIATMADEAVVLGAMQRASEIAADVDAATPLLVRGSGGAEVRVGPGTLWMQLALERPSALVACEPSRLLNRYVRPLLRALAKVGAAAGYFDRDWISVAKRPAGIVAFAHDAGSGRALVEAFVAVRSPFAVRARPSYLGKPPATLAEVGAEVDLATLSDVIVDAYATAYGRSAVEMAPAASPEARPAAAATVADPRSEPPWAAVREEAIGIIAAGRDREGRVRVGGELMASRDVVARLEGEIAEAPEDDGARIDRAVDALAGRGVAMLGVRSLRSIRDVVCGALASPG